MVTYTQARICALKGSTVKISCTYNYYYSYGFSSFWFRPDLSHQWQSPSQPEDLQNDRLYRGRVRLVDYGNKRSTLEITDLKESDSAIYLFTFKSGSFEWGSRPPGTTLIVTGEVLNTLNITSAVLT